MSLVSWLFPFSCKVRKKKLQNANHTHKTKKQNKAKQNKKTQQPK